MRWLRPALIVTAVLLWFLLGYALGGAPSHTDTEPPSARDAAFPGEPAERPGPEADGPEVTVQLDTPTAPQRSETGAIAAAVSFLELTEQAVTLDPSDAAELQRSISTDAAADRLAADVEATMTDVAASVPDGVTVSVSPLGARAGADGDGWAVSVWYVEVVAYGNELAVEQWRTATYTLEWHGDRWLMADLESVDGPTPVRPAATVASSTAELLVAMESMSDEGLVP